MKLRLALAVVAALGVIAPTAGAAIATLDTVPAATLLLPVFETDLDNPNGRNTVFRIGNVSAEATIAHVTLWTDLGIPTLDFNVYLAGYDVATVDMRLVFEGILPVTSPDLVDNGPFSSPPRYFPDCDVTLPAARFPQNLRDLIAAAHTGEPVPQFGQLCAGVTHGDRIARGWVTIDNATRCTLLYPSDPGYFSGPTRAASDANVLWGDWWMIDRTNNASYGDTLVAVEASATDPATTTPGTPTFYGRFVNWTAEDRREALPSKWQVRTFVDDSTNLGQTDLLVWRDPGVEVQPFACGTLPAPFPLAQDGAFSMDEEENGVDINLMIVAPWAANRIAAGHSALPIPFSEGYLFLDLDTSVGSPVDPSRQAFVASVHSRLGRWSVCTMGIPVPAIPSVPNTVSPPTTTGTSAGSEVAP